MREDSEGRDRDMNRNKYSYLASLDVFELSLALVVIAHELPRVWCTKIHDQGTCHPSEGTTMMFLSVFQSTLNSWTSFLCALIPLPFACLQCPNPATQVSNNYFAKFTPTLSQLLRLIIGHLRSETEPVASSRLPLRLKNDFKSLSPPLRTFFKTLMSAVC